MTRPIAADYLPCGANVLFTWVMFIRRQSAFTGLVVLGLAALIVDRVFLSEPEAAKAQPSAATTRPSARPPIRPSARPSVASPTSRPAVNSLSDRLRQVQEADQSRLAKARKVVGLAEPAAQSAPKAPSPVLQPPKPDPAEKFRRAHRLTATLLNGQLSQAMVDGRFITLGQALDGFRLTAVSSTTATFESADAKVVLATVAQPAWPRTHSTGR